MAVLSTLRHLFPPPQFMTLPSVGVDISDNSLKYIQFHRRHSRDVNLELTHWGDIEIPTGVLERGNVHDLEKLADVLREMRARTKTEYVRVSLPEERAYLFESSVKRGTPFKEVRGILEFKLEENVPLSPREVYFDYDIVDVSEEEMHVTVAVYAKEIINNYYEACKKAKVIPLSFEIEAQAIARAAVAGGQSGTYMIIDFGKTRMGIGIVHDGVLMYTSTIDTGGYVLSAAMREKLGDLSDAELTEIKNTQGILPTGLNKEVYETLQPIMSTITEELETRIHYWSSRDSDAHMRTIDKIVLCGGSSNLAGLSRYFEDTLRIPTEHARVWQNAFSLETFVPPISRRYAYGYATAIGLGLFDFVRYD